MAPERALLLDTPIEDCARAASTTIKAFDLLPLSTPLEEGAEEIVDRRGPTSKVFRLPNGQQRLIAGQIPLHYLNSSLRLWRDSDLTAYDDGQSLRWNTGFYHLAARRFPPRIEYINRSGQLFIMEPDTFGAELAAHEYNATSSSMTWRGGAGLAIRMHVYPARIRVETIVAFPDAPHQFRWRYVMPCEAHSIAEMEDGALDARGYRAEVRARYYMNESYMHDRRGERIISSDVHVTGRSMRYNERRQQEWVDDISYPVVVRD